jgi:uncharacterized protein (DUF1684 family)
MQKLLTTTIVFLITLTTFSQKKTYKDSLQSFINEYIKTHGVVNDDDKKSLQFYPINEKFRFNCSFERVQNSPWFMMETSGLVKKSHRIYGKIHFTLNDTAVTLCVYQSQDLMKVNQLKDYLFIPFMDATTGEETFESGRYFDFSIKDIKGNTLVVDFNKAYNPYCAYSTGYNCPVPPSENRISVAILAGEKKYLKSVN